MMGGSFLRSNGRRRSRLLGNFVLLVATYLHQREESAAFLFAQFVVSRT